jgi:hypothetical protein
MKSLFGVLAVCILFGVTMGCERNRGVYAANEEKDTYQPRPARLDAPDNGLKEKELKGELLRVDLPNKRFAVRVANGMEQTFEFDDSTMVTGPVSQMGNLMAKEGSEVTVQWRDDNGAKLASNIDVTQLVASKNIRRHGRKR